MKSDMFSALLRPFTVVPYGYNNSTPLTALPYWLACVGMALRLQWMAFRFGGRFKQYRHFHPCPGCGRPAHLLLSTLDSDGCWHPECEQANAQTELQTHE